MTANQYENSPMPPEDQLSSSQSVPAAEHTQAVGSEAACCEPRWDCSECTSETNIDTTLKATQYTQNTSKCKEWH